MKIKLKQTEQNNNSNKMNRKKVRDKEIHIDAMKNIFRNLVYRP